MEFNITEEDIPVPKCCPILGIPLRFGEGRVIDNTPSVDRIDNSKGYIKGNVRVISHRANKLKSDITVAQVKRLLQYMTQACLDGECKVGKDWSITH